jgi:nicotinate-nucleotide pyrophosphorylase (carboxylating)
MNELKETWFGLTIDRFIDAAVSEDLGEGDLTSLATIANGQTGKALCLIKEDCTVAGIELSEKICARVDPTLVFDFGAKDGDSIQSVACIGEITGSIHSILTIERLMLNCMQRMSGIATKTRRLVDLVSHHGVQLLDTRKTTPNFRACEKWAVRIGGGVNHRFGLYDQMLIKDNHIQAAMGIKNAIQSCLRYRQVNNIQVPLVVEVKNGAEFIIAKDFKEIDRILIDNFKPDQIHQLLILNDTNKKIEASGGINASNILEYAQTGIDFISMGDLTHHVESVDISLKIK